MRKICFFGLVLLSGCGHVESTSVSPADFKLLDGSETQNALAEVTAIEMKNYLDIDIAQVSVHFFITWEDQQSLCHGFAGCTSPQVRGYRVNTYWPDSGWEVGHPYMLAHELCHVYYFEHDERDGDPNHTHTECFARPDTGYYGEGEGWAWQTAKTITEEYGEGSR